MGISYLFYIFIQSYIITVTYQSMYIITVIIITIPSFTLEAAMVVFVCSKSKCTSKAEVSSSRFVVFPFVSIGLKVLSFSWGSWTYWTFVPFSISFSFLDITIQILKEISVKLFLSGHTTLTNFEPFIDICVLVSYLCNFATSNLFNNQLAI